MGKEPTIKLSWDFDPIKYNHFTDLGNYLIQMNDVDASDFEAANRIINAEGDSFAPHCTAAVKRNSKGEVVIGRNMDIEISQNPAYMTRIHGGTYEVLSFVYAGLGSKYRYDQCADADADEAFCARVPFSSCDAMNEAGLYLEANIREVDIEYPFACAGTNPGKERCAMGSVVALAALNCATVPEVVEFLNNSYDWYSASILIDGVRAAMNLGIVAGDAQGNYGLIEFGKNDVYYTPFAPGQANYYIHPSLAEYALFGSGFGRLAAALEGLPVCDTEQDMMDSIMAKAGWKREILDVGSLGYSDLQTNVNGRRATPQEEMQAGLEAQLAPVRPLAEKFYAGDEKPLRDDGGVWTTSFNIGVNCAKKHLILRLWENDGIIVDVQW